MTRISRPTSRLVPVLRTSRAWVLFGALVLAVGSCGGTLNGAVDAYHHADYPHAAREFRQAALHGVAPGDGGRFHLYCGLTQLALGDAGRAMVHLTQARATLDRDADYFSLDERARLQGAWRSLGYMPGQSLAWQQGFIGPD